MADVERAIAESKPMLEDVLAQLGLRDPARPLNLQDSLVPFSNWLEVDSIAPEDRFFVASLVAAFICEYLIEVGIGQRWVHGNRILMRLPVSSDTSDEPAAVREFDPYAVAVGMVMPSDNQSNRRLSLKAFLEHLTQVDEATT